MQPGTAPAHQERDSCALCMGPLGHPMRFCCYMLNFFWFRQEERRMGTSSHERRHQRRFVLFEAPSILLCFKKLKCDCWRQEQGSSLKTGQQQAGASHFLSGKQGKRAFSPGPEHLLLTLAFWRGHLGMSVCCLGFTTQIVLCWSKQGSVWRRHWCPSWAPTFLESRKLEDLWVHQWYLSH